MPRARRQASASKARATGARTARTRRPAAGQGAESAGQFVCPECGRTFTRAAALGAHRSRAHGVAGQSKRNRSRRRQAPKRSTTARTGSAAATAAGRRAAGRTVPRQQQRSTVASRDGIDRDALLKAVFPSGMPARDEVIRAASRWLDDAEQLRRMR